VAAARVTLPPGGGMPEHDHGESAALVAVQRGRIVMRAGGEERELEVGAVAAIDVGERVSLRNPGDEPASLLAVFTPAGFARTLAAWPAA
jgi:quercetin dioxygenase-like cupin family protein